MVKMSPKLKETPTAGDQDKMLIPAKQIKERKNVRADGRRPTNNQHRKGTITTFVAVKKALLAGVVYRKPIV